MLRKGTAYNAADADYVLGHIASHYRLLGDGSKLPRLLSA